MTKGGASPAQKGTAYEQELVNRFKSDGWGALRLGASGGGGDADLPDVLAGRPMSDWDYSIVWSIELKSGKATTLYVDAEEVEALRSFAQQWGARPFLGARFTTQGSGTETWLVPPGRARGPTDAGSYGLPVADVDERAAVVVSDEGVEWV